MKVPVYNQQGEKVETTELPSEIFDVKINPDLVHQVVVSQMANRRQATAHAKTRKEVRGGGKKPWRQKGTGRARHGSIRSPLWRGGGITFGPTKEKIFKKDIPKKMRRRALFMVLSAKAKNNLLVVLDKISIDKAKTKQIRDILEKLPCRRKSALIVLARNDKKIILAARNLSDVNTINVKEINPLELLSFKYLVFPKDSIKAVEKIFYNNNNQ